VVIDHKHLFEVLPSGKFWSYGPERQIEEVRRHTYFLSGLKPANYGILLSRLRSAKDLRSYWSDFTDNHDAIMFSVCVALSGQNVPWELIKRIRISLVSNLIQARDKFLISRKAYLAKMRKHILTDGPCPELPRNLSWMREIFTRITDPKHSKCYVEKYMTLLNKRSCGVPKDPAFIESKLLEFFDSVNQPERDNSPFVYRELVAATLKVSEHFVPRNLSASATVLITTSACFERSEKQGGKLSLVQEIARSDSEQVMYDLTTGAIGPEKAIRLADKILHGSLQKYKESYKDLYSTRVCALPELGMKMRIPTCSSFYRTQILQPISKILLESLKGVPELRAGLSLERQGWEAYKTFKPGEFLQRANDSVLCSDYTSSTDWIKRSVAKQAYDALTAVAGIPKWYKEVGKEVYFHNLVHLPREKCANRTIHVVDPSKERPPKRKSVLNSEHPITSGLMMGDPITKALLSFLSLMVGLKFADPRSGGAPSTKIFIVGDDFVAIGPRGDVSRFRACAENLGFIVSMDDTFVSRHWAHFTEFCFRIPRNRWEDYSLCRVLRHHPCYADAIRPRIVMRVGKSGSNESDPRVGRLRLLAQEMGYIPETHVSGTMFHLATVWQDVQFGIRSAIPYLPHFFGGMGKVPPPGYLSGLRQDKAVALLYVANHYLSWPKDRRVYHPAREFLRARVQLNTQLYNSHMGEARVVNLTNITNLVEARKDFAKFAVITAADQVSAGVNLSRVLSHENHHVVTSDMLAERLYIFSTVMKTVYDVDVLNAPILDAEPQIPDEVWEHPQLEGHGSYRELAEEFIPCRTIYLKEVMGLLDTSMVTHPKVPLTVDILANAEKPGETDLQEFAYYVRQLKGHTDDVRAWMNVPRKIIDADSILKHIARLTFALTGETPMIATRDRSLLREAGAQGLEGIRIEADVDTALAIRQWGRDLDDPLLRKAALELLAKRIEDGPLVSGRQVLLDPANVEATRLERFAQRDLPKADSQLVRKYLLGNYAPFVERDASEFRSVGDFIKSTFSSLRSHVGQ